MNAPILGAALIAAVPLLMSLVLLVAGLRLVWRGFRSQRIGDEPHCGTCNYLLIGIQSERCPECGHEISEQTILRGQWHRRPRMVGIGLAMVLVAAGVGIFSGRHLYERNDWYWLRPTYLVMRDLSGPARVPKNIRAMNELMRRDPTWRMSQSQRTELIEKAIASLATRSAMSSLYFDYLDRQIKAGQVTAAQQLKMFPQLMTTSIHPVGAHARPGATGISLAADYRGPGSWNATVTAIHGRLDGGENFKLGDDSELNITQFPSRASVQMVIPTPVLGHHSFELLVGIEWFATHEDRAKKNPLYREQRTHRITFQIVDNSAVGILKLTDDPQFRQRIQSALRPNSFVWDGPSGSKQISGNIAIGNVPVPVAFEVFARYGGKEYSIGPLLAGAGTVNSATPRSARIIGEVSSVPPPAMIDLVFRSSEAVARSSIEMFEVWKGELIYTDIPVAMPNGR